MLDVIMYRSGQKYDVAKLYRVGETDNCLDGFAAEGEQLKVSANL